MDKGRGKWRRHQQVVNGGGVHEGEGASSDPYFGYLEVQLDGKKKYGARGALNKWKNPKKGDEKIKEKGRNASSTDGTQGWGVIEKEVFLRSIPKNKEGDLRNEDGKRPENKDGIGHIQPQDCTSRIKTRGRHG